MVIEILLAFATNIGHRWREWRTVDEAPRISWHALTDREPKRYRITQPAKPFKARQTWERSMRRYLAERKERAS